MWKRNGVLHMMNSTQVAVWDDEQHIRIIIDGRDTRKVKRVQQIVFAVLTALEDTELDIYTGSPVRE